MLLSISKFARLVGTTIDALYYYEKKGLFLPEKVGEDNGYRYYSLDQINRILTILQLKHMGFSVSEIGQYIGQNLTIDDKIKWLTERRDSISTLIGDLEQISRGESNYICFTKRSITVQCITEEMKDVTYEELHRRGMKMYNRAKRDRNIGLVLPVIAIVVFHGERFNVERLNAKAYLAVENGTEKLVARQLACAIHRGSQETIKAAYDALFKYCEKENYQIVGEVYERYLINYISVQDPNQFVTEVAVSVERKKK